MVYLPCDSDMATDDETEPERDEMEAPDSDTSLYLATGDDVPETRALLTGDIVDGIAIAGLDDPNGLAIILTHPCSMRVDGVTLSPRIVVARVRPYQHVALGQWTGYARLMPLPSLIGDQHHACYFDSIGIAAGAELASAPRIACLSDRGINLLQQRFIFNLTRFVVPTARLHEACVAVFREVDLQEEWVSAAADAGFDQEVAICEFHDWIRAEDAASGVMRQERLQQAQAIGALERDLRAEIKSRYGPKKDVD